ncbi:MAG: hypothetical protein KA974_11665 [Saprospiraceae bacterium]|nr:hypothetical protein [Saprospiraceae bacterium]
MVISQKIQEFHDGDQDPSKSLNRYNTEKPKMGDIVWIQDYPVPTLPNTYDHFHVYVFIREKVEEENGKKQIVWETANGGQRNSVLSDLSIFGGIDMKFIDRKISIDA